MPWLDETKKSLVAPLLAYLDGFMKRDWVHLDRSELAENLRFDGEGTRMVQPLALELVELCGADTEQLLSWPVSAIAVALQGAESLSKAIEELEQFDPARHSPDQVSRAQRNVRVQITQHVNGAYNAISLLRVEQQNRIFQDSRKLTEDIERYKIEFDKRKTDLEQRLDRTSTALEAARRATDDHLAARQGLAFQARANVHARRSLVWVGAALVTVLVLFGFVWLLFQRNDLPILSPLSWTAAGNLAYFGPRVLVVTVLSFLTVVFVRNFRAAQHNQILNEQRASAMATFADFRAAASTDRARDMITLRAAESVFAVHPTGYGSTEPVAATPLTELVETVRPRIDSKT